MAHQNQFGLGHDALAQQMAATRSYQQGLPTFMRHLYGFGNVLVPTVLGAQQRVNTADSSIADALSTLKRRVRRCRLPECDVEAAPHAEAEGYCGTHWAYLTGWRSTR